MAAASASLPDAQQAEAAGTELLEVVSHFVRESNVSQRGQQRLLALSAAAKDKRQSAWDRMRGGPVPSVALLKEVHDAGVEVENLEAKVRSRSAATQAQRACFNQLPAWSLALREPSLRRLALACCLSSRLP